VSEAHATLSASGSAKWLSCPGALGLEGLINAPDDGNVNSWEGTAAHEVLEMSLKLDKEPEFYLGHKITVDNGSPDGIGIAVTQEMVDAVEVVIDYSRRLTTKKGFYEERLDYSHIAPNGFGTGDIVLEVYEKVAAGKRVNTLYIIDFKYGFDKVNAYENSQLKLYALGALNSLDLMFEREIERIVIVIAQPRIDNISEYEISIADLLKWGEEEVKPKAKIAYDLYATVTGVYLDHPLDNGEEHLQQYLKPTKDGCKWCQGRRLKRCKAQAQMGYSAAVEGFDDLTVEEKNELPAIEVSKATIKDRALLDNADLAAIYLKMQIFLAFAEGLGDEITSRIKSGQIVPGLGLRPTEKPRAWIGDDDETIKAMRTAGLQKQDYEKIDLISPTEAEKKLKEVKPKDHKRRYKKLEIVAIHRPPGKDKIIEDNTEPAEDFEDDLLSIGTAEDFEDDLLS